MLILREIEERDLDSLLTLAKHLDSFNLRIVAYVLHPIGVIFDYVLLRPFHWIGSHEPFKTLFGHRD